MIFKEEDFPSRCGVYIFKDNEGNPLYIGKAKDIRKRLKSHFQEESFKKLKLLNQTERIDFIITPDELSALFLENNLIKKYQPKFNVNLKDDKTYPFIEITIKDKFPKIFYTRKVREGSIYFGPFYPAQKARKIISFIQKNFGIAVCKRDLNKEYKKPCLFYNLKKCLGPCVPGLTNSKIYRKKVEQAILFLKGKNKKLLKNIQKEIEEKAKNLRFEEAMALKDVYFAIEEINKVQDFYKKKSQDFDVFGFCIEGNTLALTVLNFKNGLLLGKKSYIFENLEEMERDFFLSQILPQYYLSNPLVPDKIILPLKIEEDIFKQFLKERKGKIVKIRVPLKGKDKKFLKMAEENAKEFLHHRYPNKNLEELKEILGLKKLSNIIGIDISHLQGKERFGGIVFYGLGKFDKKKYRTFKITTEDPRDDPGGIREIIKRYLSRAIKEEKELPDLILIDGGKSQLMAGVKAREELKLEAPMVALEKGAEKIYTEKDNEPLILKKDSSALLLLMKIRDEAHRFVITLHRRMRGKKFLKSKD
ncbi:MAG: excinuclease ABC subunit UvrC [Thermoanaerobaculia bacterium]